MRVSMEPSSIASSWIVARTIFAAHRQTLPGLGCARDDEMLPLSELVRSTPHPARRSLILPVSPSTRDTREQSRVVRIGALKERVYRSRRHRQ